MEGKKILKLIAAVSVCLAIAMLILFYAVPQTPTPPLEGEGLEVKGGPYLLYGRASMSEKIDSHPVLVIILHGDGPPPYQYPSYQYTFASKVATMNQNVVAIGLLRPGYTDPGGNHSEGNGGNRDGDNWNAQNTDAIADAIAKLRHRYNASKVVIAGHSGGSAITANILGRHPDLIDAALLVSCPCGKVNEWRKSMLRLTGLSTFKGDINSLSPITQVKGVSDKAHIVMMVGTLDKVAPIKFSKVYQMASVKADKDVTLIKLKGQPHNTFLYPKVFAELATLISREQG